MHDRDRDTQRDLGGDAKMLVTQFVGIGCATYVLWHCFKPTITEKPRKELGVRGASPIYADEKGAKLLVAPNYDLQGKPDFIFETWCLRRYIPLEIKSGRLKPDEEPHLGDIYQVIAYFLIIEEVYGKRPPYGKLVYANKTFTIRNTPRLRRELKKILKEMRSMLKAQHQPKVTPSFVKCKNCVCQRTVCEFQK